MCERFYLTSTAAEIRKQFKIQQVSALMIGDVWVGVVLFKERIVYNCSIRLDTVKHKLP
jgi:hypothetical protein